MQIGDILENLLKNTGLDKGVDQNKALLLWDQVVGKVISKNTTPKKVEHGIVYVETNSPTWRQELQFKKQDIIKKINKKIGKNSIKDIRFI